MPSCSFLRDAVLADMPGATRPRTTHWPRDCCPTRAHRTNKWPHLVDADSMSHPWGIDVLRSAACKRRYPKPTACTNARVVLLAIGFARESGSSHEAMRYAKDALTGDHIDVFAALCLLHGLNPPCGPTTRISTTGSAG